MFLILLRASEFDNILPLGGLQPSHCPSHQSGKENKFDKIAKKKMIQNVDAEGVFVLLLNEKEERCLNR